MKVLIFGGIDLEASRLYVARSYYEAVLSIGAKPYIFPLSELSINYIEEYINEFECLVFCGGEDVHPKYYNQEPQISIRKINLLRDKIEIQALRAAYRQNKRVLSICRGIQVMNVAFGGTLKQDINNQGFISHWQELEKSEGYHKVEIKGELFKSIFCKDEIYVNSFHHQAIDELADGFLIEAISKDGVIEAISKVDREFFVGVQWHPELMWEKDNLQLNLFKKFIGG